MAGVLRIYDQPVPELLPRILEVLGQGEPLPRWALLLLEGGDEELAQKVSERQTGVPLTWDEMRALGPRLDSMTDIVLVGTRQPKVLESPRLKEEIFDDNCDRVEIALELFDATFWRIYAHDERILAPFKKAFQKVKGGAVE